MKRYYLVLSAIAILFSNSIKSMEESSEESTSSEREPYNPQKLACIQSVIQARSLQSPDWAKTVVNAPPGITPIHAWNCPNPIPATQSDASLALAPTPITAAPSTIAAFPRLIRTVPHAETPLRRSKRIRKKFRALLTTSTDGLNTRFAYLKGINKKTNK